MKQAWWLVSILAGAAGKATPGGAGRRAVRALTVLAEGVIVDGRTGLQWVVGPDRDMDFGQAVAWVAAWPAAGGGWRMPTREELRSLYHPGSGQRNLAPAFQTTGWWVWAEPRDAQSAWSFSYNHGCATWDTRINSCYGRAFGVRRAPR